MYVSDGVGTLMLAICMVCWQCCVQMGCVSFCLSNRKPYGIHRSPVCSVILCVCVFYSNTPRDQPCLLHTYSVHITAVQLYCLPDCTVGQADMGASPAGVVET